VQCSHHHIYQLAVSKAIAKTGARSQVSTPAHYFYSTSQCCMAYAELYLLGSTDNGLHAAATQSIHRDCGSFMMETAVQGGYPGYIHVVRFGVNDIANNAMAHSFCINSSPLDRFRNNDSPKLARAVIFQAATKITYRGTYTAYYDNFIHFFFHL
jgi:hypothetical protein